MFRQFCQRFCSGILKKLPPANVTTVVENRAFGIVQVVSHSTGTVRCASMAASSSLWIHDALDKNCTDTFHMEFEGCLSNHLAHGVVALYRLGADQNCVNKFIKWYTQKLEPASNYPRELSDGSEALDDANMRSLLGERKSFYVILKYYQQAYQKYKNTDDLVKEMFPPLMAGMAGSVFHGVIQLGYGVSIGNKTAILEGLAYLHHSYRPLTTHTLANTTGHGDKDIVAVLGDVKRDSTLREFMLTETAKILKWKPRESGVQFLSDSIQMRTHVLLVKGGDRLLPHTNNIRFPSFYDPQVVSKEQNMKLCKWMVDCALQIFQGCEYVNDFVLLHGATASWNVMQIVPLLEPHEGLQAVRTMLCCLVATYVVQDSPELNLLQPGSSITATDWDKIVQKTFAVVGEADEHVLKLVQVCKEMWQADPSMAYLYAAAAEETLNNELTFISYPQCDD